MVAMEQNLSQFHTRKTTAEVSLAPTISSRLHSKYISDHTNPKMDAILSISIARVVACRRPHGQKDNVQRLTMPIFLMSLMNVAVQVVELSWRDWSDSAIRRQLYPPFRQGV